MMYEVEIRKPVSFDECRTVFSDLLQIASERIVRPVDLIDLPNSSSEALSIWVDPPASDPWNSITLDQYPYDKPLDLLPLGPELVAAFGCEVALSGAFEHPYRYVIFRTDGSQMIAEMTQVNSPIEFSIEEGPFPARQWKCIGGSA